MLPGEQAFRLHDTYGFPIDLTLEMAAEQGLQVDTEAFRRLMTEQRERAKADAKANKSAHGNSPAYRQLRDQGETRVHRLHRAADRVHGARHRGRRRAGPARPRPARSSRWCWTRPRSTPSPVARSPTRAASSRPARRLRVLDVQKPIKGLIVHRVEVVEGELGTGETRPRPRSIRSGGGRPGRRTPAPTWCTPRCARCSARPRCRAGPTTGPATCGWTSPGARR